MNPYTTWTQARIQPRDMANAVFTDPLLAAAAVTVLERQRSWQAEAEVDRLLKEHGVPPASAASLVAMLRQAIGVALVRAGQRLATAPPSDASTARALADGTRSRSVLSCPPPCRSRRQIAATHFHRSQHLRRRRGFLHAPGSGRRVAVGS